MNGVEDSQNIHDNSKAAVSNAQILHALEVIHNPRSANLLRQEASQFLEQVKLDKEAPYHGFTLASSKAQPAVMRHFGLSLLDHAIRDQWVDYSLDQRTALRDWVLRLSEDVSAEDPLFIRNKIVEIWVEVAKRSWVLEWMNMDEHLARLWDCSIVQKLLVLTVLETLSEDIFANEDSTAGLRNTDLSRACVEIFTPATVLIEQFPSRDASINVRYGEEGWLSRIGDLIDSCTDQSPIDDQKQACTISSLSTLKSAISWVIPKALIATRTLQRVCECLAVPNMPIQLAAVDALYNLYSRSKFSDEDFRGLVLPLFGPESMGLLRRLYEWSVVDASNIDDEKYLLSKKFSETVFNVGGILEKRLSLISEDDLRNFLDLLLLILRNESLHVSIPALHLWQKLLDSDELGGVPAVTAHIGALLEICSHRMIRYQNLPEDSPDPSITFLNQDVDTMPERHAFTGNYSRLCHGIVQIIARHKPVDALYHILSQADHVIDHLYDGEPPFQPRNYVKFSLPFLRIDAHLAVVEAALRGWAQWLIDQSTFAINCEREHEEITSNLHAWCERLMGLHFEDPAIKERVISFATGFASNPLKGNAPFAFKVIEYTLDAQVPDDKSCLAYNDAAKEFRSFCIHQLQRLAMRFSDVYITILDELEKRMNSIARDELTRNRYSTVLFIITHRATDYNEQQREMRLEQTLQPIMSQWQDENLSRSLPSFDGFCELVGLGGIHNYIAVRNLHRIQNWSAHQLDEEGKLHQLHMQRSIENLPIRPTKTLLGVSIEKLEVGSRAYNIASALWQKKIPLILPNLLLFISQAHAFHNPASWSHLPPEIGNIIQRILTDRFWQVGISSGSRDEFYAKVGGTKMTLEGFASSIRATMRSVRENSYRILHSMSVLGDSFYGHEELPGPLARALFTDACSLSTHQMTIMVEIIRPIIENCPVAHRAHFLTPILATLFEQLDRKASVEWGQTEQRNEGASEGDTLAEEMRDESILRQLTYTSVMLVVGILDPHKGGGSGSAIDTIITVPGSIRSFILSTPEILKPVILFCTHALRMRDTRSCSWITRVLRSLIPEFAGETPMSMDAREFISLEVLKACITSLHDSYFVDLQRDLAQLISSIIVTYAAKTETPRQILLSLPAMTTEKVDRALEKLLVTKASARNQRAVVLDLLAGLRGVSISEQGKIFKPNVKKLRSATHERYMNVNMQPDGPPKETTPELTEVAKMFDKPGSL